MLKESPTNPERRKMKTKIWSCKIGEADDALIPQGADQPMRDAVAKAYREITGKDPKFIFSGWGAELDEYEREYLNDKGKVA